MSRVKPLNMGNEKFTLRQIVDMTGISEFTLRGWELRYGAFGPDRTPTGRRQYSNNDLQKALLLRELTQRNHRIGDVAHLNNTELSVLIEAVVGKRNAKRLTRNRDVEKIMKLASVHDWDSIQKEISKAGRTKKPLDFILYTLVPLLAEIGHEVSDRQFSVAQEHILSALIKQQLHILAQPVLKASNLQFLVTTPEGDFHELGILSAQAIACQMKVRSLYLGPNTPKTELCETALRLGATHLLLASTVFKHEGAKEDFYSYVNFLDKNLPPDIQFWFAGRAAGALNLKRERLYLASPLEFHQKLRAL